MKDAVDDHVKPSLWKRAYDLCRPAFGADGPERRCAAVATEWPRGAAALEAPWSAEAVIADVMLLQPPEHPGAAPSVWDVSQRRAVAFAEKLYASLAFEAPRPKVSVVPDGGICFTWPPAVTRSEWLVELVFFRRAIAYAVVDGLDSGRTEDRLLDGETSNAGVVLRDVVTRYVVGVSS
jgi:hypothetical protein